MKTMLAALAAAATLTTLAGCSTYGYGNDPYGYYDSGYYSRYGAYDYNRPDPAYNGYYADRYYRSDPRYRPYRLRSSDRVYVGSDGRYYCRRSDGTTGVIVGGIAGGVLGAIIAPGRSSTLGAIIGAGAGAVAGGAIDANNVTCR